MSDKRIVRELVADLYLEYYKMSNDGKKTLEQLTELVGLRVPEESLLDLLISEKQELL